jgi:hypothetical protein
VHGGEQGERQDRGFDLNEDRSRASRTPFAAVDVVLRILANPYDLAVVMSFASGDFVYVS